MNRLHTATLLASVLLLAPTGCLTLDSFIYNPIHCSNVGPDTCEEKGEEWDRACVPCDEEYDWTRTYDWIEGTLDNEVTSVRPVETAIQDLVIPTDDGLAELDAVFLPSHGEFPELAQTTILYNHGRYASIEHYMPRVRFLHEAGYNVFIWDYRGYGKSMPEGAPNTEQYLADAHTARAFAEGVAPDPDKIIVYANSLGGIPAVEMSATDTPPCALFLEAAFTSMSEVSASNSGTGFPESFFSANEFDVSAELEGYRGATLVMTGNEDNFFPFQDQFETYDAVVGPKRLWIVDGAKHGLSNGGIPEAGLGQYFLQMREFLVQYAPECLTH